jgi:hypothetical protein
MLSYELDIGLHRFGFVPPHTVNLFFTGDIAADEAARVIASCGERSGGRPFTILLETPGLKNVTPGARKVFADGFKRQPLVAAGFLNATLRVRATATFVVTAINAFRAQKMSVSFFSDVDAARAWTEERLRNWAG